MIGRATAEGRSARLLVWLLAASCPTAVSAKCAGEDLLSFFETAALSAAVADVTVESVGGGVWQLRVNEVLKGSLEVGQAVEVVMPNCMHAPRKSSLVPGTRWVMTINRRVGSGRVAWLAPICAVFAAQVVKEKIEIPSEFGNNEVVSRLELAEVRRRILVAK